MPEAICSADLAIPEESWDQKKIDVHEYHINKFVIGNDWEGKVDYLKDEGVEVVCQPRTPEISTTQFKADFMGANAREARVQAGAVHKHRGVRGKYMSSFLKLCS
ncbi:MAG: hypothetical protein IJJ32_05030 [Eggerthellaceae bacterium]|nr:hypothetical protein [Eggerthellaceae bacterium]